MAVDEKNLEERKVRALEDIASSFRDLNDWMFEIDKSAWGTRFEWYLHEFHTILKAKNLGSVSRPMRDSERPNDERPQ
jgi:hypothetical protein